MDFLMLSAPQSQLLARPQLAYRLPHLWLHLLASLLAHLLARLLANLRLVEPFWNPWTTVFL